MIDKEKCFNCASENLDREPRRMLDGIFVYKCRDCGAMLLDRFPVNLKGGKE